MQQNFFPQNMECPAVKRTLCDPWNVTTNNADTDVHDNNAHVDVYNDAGINVHINSRMCPGGGTPRGTNHYCTCAQQPSNIV